MLQIQGVRGWASTELSRSHAVPIESGPQTLGNEGYAVSSAFPQGKKHAHFIKILEFTRGRFQIFKSNSSEVIRLLSFIPLWHVIYATAGVYRSNDSGLKGSQLEDENRHHRRSTSTIYQSGHRFTGY